MGSYRYVESGLDNVIIEGIDVIADDDGEDTITITNILGLHRAIAEAIVAKPTGLTGKELRFLRTEMGMTQAELAHIVGREALAIGRWERGEIDPIDQNAETIVRILAREQLNLPVVASVREIASWSLPSASTPALRIDGSNPEHYRPMGRAA